MPDNQTFAKHFDRGKGPTSGGRNRQAFQPLGTTLVGCLSHAPVFTRNRQKAPKPNICQTCWRREGAGRARVQVAGENRPRGLPPISNDRTPPPGLMGSASPGPRREEDGRIARPVAGTLLAFVPIERRNGQINMRKERPDSFSLIEMLVVIATIGLLAALVLTGIVQAKRRAQAAKCVSNLRQLGLSWGDQNFTLEHQNCTGLEHQNCESVPTPLCTALSMLVWRVGLQDTALRKRNRSGTVQPGLSLPSTPP